MVHEQVSACAGNVLCHFLLELAVDVEDDAVGCPVEAVFVELLVWSEGKMLDGITGGVGSIVAVSDGFRRLEYQLDGSLGFVELTGEEFHVDFLRVVVELWQSVSEGASVTQHLKAPSYPEESTACPILG